MKAKVLNKFRDRHNGKIYNIGEVITVSRERFEEILTVGAFVEEVKAKSKKTKEAEEAAE